MERETLTVEEAAHVLGVGRNAAYAAVRDGSIPTIRIGTRYVVPRAALDRLLESGGPRGVDAGAAKRPGPTVAAGIVDGIRQSAGR